MVMDNGNHIEKDEAYMLIARVLSMRSKDPNTKVGCVIVSDHDRILSTGYNGMPNGCSDDDFPWARDNEDETENKYMYVVHAEANALMNYRGDHQALENATAYVTLFPCCECAKLIIQSGIRTVVYESDKYHDTPGAVAARRMFDAAGVEYIHFDKEFLFHSC